ncbi:MAG: hypothetical protein JWQ81_8499 [Amycolatopsis sp.]|nr:hypothetical protein [Amycolatopsis sp.]
MNELVWFQVAGVALACCLLVLGYWLSTRHS